MFPWIATVKRRKRQKTTKHAKNAKNVKIRKRKLVWLFLSALLRSFLVSNSRKILSGFAQLWWRKQFVLYRFSWERVAVIASASVRGIACTDELLKLLKEYRRFCIVINYTKRLEYLGLRIVNCVGLEMVMKCSKNWGWKQKKNDLEVRKRSQKNKWKWKQIKNSLKTFFIACLCKKS